MLDKLLFYVLQNCGYITETTKSQGAARVHQINTETKVSNNHMSVQYQNRRIKTESQLTPKPEI